MGYVYVAEAGKYCKIGVSDVSVDQRIKTIQTGCPIKINRVWCSRNIPDHLECERKLHDKFKNKNTSGEWFDISFFDAAEEADRTCTNGYDKTRIAELEKENEELRQALNQSYTRDEIIRFIGKLIPEKAVES